MITNNDGMYNLIDRLKKTYSDLQEAEASAAKDKKRKDQLEEDPKVDDNKVKPCTPQTQKPGEGEDLDPDDVSMEKPEDVDESADGNSGDITDSDGRVYRFLHRDEPFTHECLEKDKKDSGVAECTEKELEMFKKEKSEHPEFTDEQVWQIVRDHIALGEAVGSSAVGFAKHVFSVTYKDDSGTEREDRVMAFDDADARKMVGNKGSVTGVRMVEESVVRESVEELIGEIPGIEPGEQDVLRWAIENGVVSNDMPDYDAVVDALAEHPDVIAIADEFAGGAGVEEMDFDDMSAEDRLEYANRQAQLNDEAAYVKYILLPMAKEAHEKAAMGRNESKFRVFLSGGLVKEVSAESKKSAIGALLAESDEGCKVIYVERVNEEIESGRGMYRVQFDDGHVENVEAENNVSAMKSAKEKHEGMVSSAQKVQDEVGEVKPGVFRVFFTDGHHEDVEASTRVEAMASAKKLYTGWPIVNVEVVESKEIKEEASTTGKVYRIDIDGILTVEVEGHDYEKRTPNKENIERVNTLKRAGAEIVLWTARESGDREVTEGWLLENGVEFSSLEMDKPVYDGLVDDLCVDLGELVAELVKSDEPETDDNEPEVEPELEPEPEVENESVVREEETTDKRTVVARGIVDKASADNMAREKHGVAVVDDEDGEKFMVIVKECKIAESDRLIKATIPNRGTEANHVELPEDEFLNGLANNDTFKKYGYWFSGAVEKDGQIIAEFISADAPKVEIVVYGEIVDESKVTTNEAEVDVGEVDEKPETVTCPRCHGRGGNFGDKDGCLLCDGDEVVVPVTMDGVPIPAADYDIKTHKGAYMTLGDLSSEDKRIRQY